MVKRNIPNCSLDDINVYEIDEGRGLVASIKYSVSENGRTTQYQIMTLKLALYCGIICMV